VAGIQSHLSVDGLAHHTRCHVAADYLRARTGGGRSGPPSYQLRINLDQQRSPASFQPATGQRQPDRSPPVLTDGGSLLPDAPYMPASPDRRVTVELAAAA
jgi:hypothetical protein